MSNMRYRKPSVKSLLGLTRLKKRLKKALGINKLLWPFRAVNNYQRRVLRRAGYYSPELKMMRAARRGQAPGPIGPLHLGEGEHKAGEKGLDSSALLMAALLAKGEGKDEARGHKQGSNGPNLAEALLLASALKGNEREHAPKPKYAAQLYAPGAHPHHAAEARAPHVKHAAEPHAEHAHAHDARAAHPRAAHARRAGGRRAADKPAPRRHRGLRIVGLFLVALAVATAIVAVWYYWIL